jgi:hypothetical protein
VVRGRAYGLSLNVDMDLSPFDAIDPCGYPRLGDATEGPRHLLDGRASGRTSGGDHAAGAKEKGARKTIFRSAATLLSKPSWIRAASLNSRFHDQGHPARAAAHCGEEASFEHRRVLRQGHRDLHDPRRFARAVARSATSRTAGCCPRQESRPPAETIARLKLKYVVITSVDRDDLKDGGAQHFVTALPQYEKFPKPRSRPSCRIFAAGSIARRGSRLRRPT